MVWFFFFFLCFLLFLAAGEFAEKLNQHHRARQQNITARCLAPTTSVRAENIPPGIPSDYITVYFENKKNGGAQVVNVQQLPEEDAAIITFHDHKGNAETRIPYFFEMLPLQGQNVNFLE